MTPIPDNTQPMGRSETDEGLLDVDDIQGNILTAFNKDHQLLIALSIRDVSAAKAWLSRLAPHISSLSEVWQFNRLFRAKRRRLGHDPAGLIATWVNIAFSYGGIAKLTSPTDANAIPSGPFKQGLPDRAASLGDVSAVEGEGVSDRWVVGADGHVPDILLIIGSDDTGELGRVSSFLCPGTGDLAGSPEVIFRELGETRTDLPGHEHFGFKDGISQPAVRGLISKSPDIYLSDRVLADSPEGEISFAKPGAPLVRPGEFVFGYPSNNPKDGTPVPPNPQWPSWIRNGSLLVFRRLRQDVAAFQGFLRSAAAALAATPDFPGMNAQLLGAMLVGRWPSGAPIARARTQDDLNLANDPNSVNDFLFAQDTDAPRFKPGYGTTKSFPRAMADQLGGVCPCAAHIRKVNPRDQDSDKGNDFDTLTRRILRRGIPFGPPLAAPPGGQLPVDDGIERGLHFLCYQTSIEDQFELLQTDWANSTTNPHPFGHDVVIGQPAVGRREVQLLSATGGGQDIQTNRTFVTMTGGGYFFAPSISALSQFLAKPS
jgi:Dyp-type peroxidase family